MRHPLDIDLLDYVEGLADEANVRLITDHLPRCRWCRIKRLRLVNSITMDP